MLRLTWISAIVVVLDQITKIIAHKSLTLYAPIVIIENYFNISLAYNEGAAFSFLASAGGWQRWFFIILTVVVSALVIYWIKNLKEHEKTAAVGFALILGGAIGNLIDRVYLGKVIDFIQVHYQNLYYWPTFNIADSAITLGAAILIADGIAGARKAKSADQAE